MRVLRPRGAIILDKTFRGLLEIKDVSNVYITRSLGLFGRREKKAVLDRINLEIGEAEILGLVGESGCGKTTLGRAVLGLIDFTGEIRIGGLRQGGGRGRLEMAGMVQAVFQDPAESLNPVRRIGAILEEPLVIHRTGSAKERSALVDHTLALVGLDPSYKSRRVSELSGGQKQRIAIGAALMLRPRLIIADEAVSSLDVSVAAQILNLFRELHRSLGLAILFISHNLNVVYYLCSRIAVMYKGQIVELGGAEDIYAMPAHPYTRFLLDSIPDIRGRGFNPAAGGPAEKYGGRADVSGVRGGEPETGGASSLRLPEGGCRFAERCPFRTSICGRKTPELVNIAGLGKAEHRVRCTNFPVF
ncbi:MAG: ABC transporter ATP-binding protein [Treponema sp.]|jgi:ABC-type glutathione transport system ATPase component|nr:ABC transporter ATP-binding protein [Treponema sp.]